jgi:hypothetical protein
MHEYLICLSVKFEFVILYYFTLNMWDSCKKNKVLYGWSKIWWEQTYPRKMLLQTTLQFLSYLDCKSCFYDAAEVYIKVRDIPQISAKAYLYQNASKTHMLWYAP